MEDKVFVYGTLKMGGHFARDSYLSSFRKHVEKAMIKGTLYNLGWFPGINLKGNNDVHGEIHTFDNFEKVVNILDSIEGYTEHDPENSLYIRRRVHVNGQDVWVYEFNKVINDEYDVVESGIWEV